MVLAFSGGTALRDDVHIVCIPTSDRAFSEAALGIADGIPQELPLDDARPWFTDELRRTFPHATVEELGDAPPAPGQPIWYVRQHEHPFRIDARVMVPLSVEAAFEVYVDRVVEWQSAVELTRVDTSAALVGREYRATYPFLGMHYAGTFQVVAASPPVEVALEAQGSGIRVWYVARFAAEGAGTLVRVRGDYELPTVLLTRMADHLGLERAVAHDIERANQDFRRLCQEVAQERAPGSPVERAPTPWSAAVERLRLAQERYRSLVGGAAAPTLLVDAEEDLLAARGTVEQLKRELAAEPAVRRQADEGIGDGASGAS
jgi:hypothetical protein